MGTWHRLCLGGSRVAPPHDARLAPGRRYAPGHHAGPGHARARLAGEGAHMIGDGPLALITAGVAFVPALVWTIIAHDALRFLHSRQPRSPVFRLLPFIGGAA